MATPRLILVGVFGAAHGVRGEIRVKSFTQDPKSIGDYRPLTDIGGERRFTLTSVRPIKDEMIVARVEGVADRNAAEALTGIELFARRDQLPAADEDEYYHADLVGLAAETEEGAPLGAVVAVRNFGAGDLLEIERPEGGETLLLPFTRAVAPLVDIANRRIVITPPDIEVEEP
jgi:16S rRNA processing protein RimM